MTEPQASSEADRLAADLLPTRMDELAMEGRTDPSALDQLWAMAFALPRWYFVGTGQFPNVQPLAVVIDKKPYAMAFTAKGRADEYARKHGVLAIGDKPSILSFKVESAVRRIVPLQRVGVFGILFDDARGGWCIPLQRLPDMLVHFQPGGPGSGGRDPRTANDADSAPTD
jgi:hypothetical protein